jgi:hypothetical protein
MTCSTFSLYTASAIPVVRSPAASEVERQTWRLMMHTDSLTVYIAEIDGDPVGTATSCLTSAMPSTGPIVSTRRWASSQKRKGFVGTFGTCLPPFRRPGLRKKSGVGTAYPGSLR